MLIHSEVRMKFFVQNFTVILSDRFYLNRNSNGALTRDGTEEKKMKNLSVTTSEF
jgi:hypothetical protein